ncbi:hypothetical protein [Variovorax soli]|uniref:Group 4 capsule polysaccharide lipoprotein gfcB, YjbF n=1 Tax=Variovorax soli TaxID=376815 RepID=A0ABU1NHV7_9BURK|nr:hypothetical protein [Variovorax soli]MDR6538034.1 hypothetical protein [Variovorax soli]
MNILPIFAILAVPILASCGVDRHVTNHDLDWRPPALSMVDCPILSGDYIYAVTQSGGGNVSNLLNVYAGSIYVLWQTALVNPTTGRAQTPVSLKTLPDFQSYYVGQSSASADLSNLNEEQRVLHLELTSHTLIQGVINQTRVVTPLGTAMAGCSDGALILRHLENNGGNDFVPRTVSYGEFELRRNSDDALTISYRRRQRSISLSTGGLGEIKEFPSLTRVYPLAKR